jgi:hypothetical protein
MNTTEKIVESYFRLCKKCFTLPDVKVIDGNNRQIDLLAYHIQSTEQYHVEVSVTHCQNWCPDKDDLIDSFEKKFFGVPTKKEGKNTDYSKGKTYETKIYETYQAYGLDLQKIKRIWVCWTVIDESDINREISNYCEGRNINKNPIEILKFRDQILPALMKEVSTSNYEDDSLRTLSLLRQYEKQTNV